MAGEFSQISADSSGYVQSPQDVVKQDLSTLEALQRAPQDDPLVQREERSLSRELSDALQNMNQSQRPMSHDDMINALAMSMLRGDHERQPQGAPYDDMLGSENEFGGGNDMSSIFGADDSENSLGGGRYGFDDGSNDFEGGADASRYAPLAGYSATGKDQYDNNDRHDTGISADSDIQLNSDSTLGGTANGQSLSAGNLLKTSHDDLIDVSKNDLPNGFKLSNTVGDWTGAGNNYTQSINGEVGGSDGQQHKVEVWTDDTGEIKAQVDGKKVDETHPDPNGIVNFQSGGPGQCGIVSINGKNDKTGAQIQVKITKDITNTNGVHGPAAKWAHHGLNAEITNTCGADGRPLEIGGAIGQQVGQQAGTQ